MNDRANDRIHEHLQIRLGDVQRLLDGWRTADNRSLENYAVSFDYIEAGTTEGQHEAYWRYRMAYGTLCEEFRYFFDPRTYAFRAEYWFLEWDHYFTYHKYGDRRDCTRDPTIIRLWKWLVDSGAVASASTTYRH